MGLERRSNSEWWYGRFEVAGKRMCKSLGVRIRGKPGDALYQQSMARAQAKLDQLIEDAQSRKSTVEVIKQIHQLQTGCVISTVHIDDMADAWDQLPRKRRPTERHLAVGRSRISKFVVFLKQHHPKVECMHQVTPDIALAFLRELESSGVTSKTYNEHLKQLRSLFNKLRRQAGLPDNPLADIPYKDEGDTVPRMPFSTAELKAIFDEVKDDEFIRPIVVVAFSTAMRRGDCCQLKWSSVDLDGGFITVKTSKTGATVDIPIFPVLRAELEKRHRDSIFVFPAQAEAYRRNPDEITQRVKRAIARALLPEQDRKRMHEQESITADEIKRRVDCHLDRLSANTKGVRKAKQARSVFNAYLDGATIKEAAAMAEVSTGTAHALLNDLQRAVGVPIIRKNFESEAQDANFDQQTRAERITGVRRASVRDFHSFRSTWITLALTAGVPLEMVKRVSGHKTTEIVLKCYFKPSKAEFRDVLQLKMPNLLPAGVAQPAETADIQPTVEADADLDRALTVLDGMDARNWMHRRVELRELIQAFRSRAETRDLRHSA